MRWTRMRWNMARAALLVGALMSVAGASMADTQNTGAETGRAETEGAAAQKFSRLSETKGLTAFDLDGEALDFSTWVPERFLWSEAQDVPVEFAPAALFSTFEQVRIGYDPLERDRYEVRLYRATLYPDRVALAVSYARLLARVWSSTDFGMSAPDPMFGEVLGGTDASGAMMVNRISVWRRGEELLILRQRFEAERFENYAEDMAKMVGSLSFKTALDTPLVGDDAPVRALATRSGAPWMARFPAHWQEIDAPLDLGAKGVFSFWRDTADAKGNLAAMIASVPAPADLPNGPPGDASFNDLADTAAAMAHMALGQLAPDQPFTLAPVEASRIGDLAQTTAFNALYTFRVELGEAKALVKLDVMLAYGKDGQLLSFATVAPAGTDLYLEGTSMHASYVQKILLETLTAYFGAGQAQ